MLCYVLMLNMCIYYSLSCFCSDYPLHIFGPVVKLSDLIFYQSVRTTKQQLSATPTPSGTPIKRHNVTRSVRRQGVMGWDNCEYFDYVKLDNSIYILECLK